LRWASKAAATLLVGGLPVAISGAVAIAVIEEGDLHGAMATAGGLLAGAAAYTAIFTWAGLALRHALVAGLVYFFVWEAVLAAFVTVLLCSNLVGPAKIAQLEDKLRSASVIDASELSTDEVRVGTTVHVKDEKTGKSVKYAIVGSAEANPSENKLPNESPVGPTPTIGRRSRWSASRGARRRRAGRGRRGRRRWRG